MCNTNFHRLGLALAGNPLDYSSNKEIVCNHFVGLLLYVQRKIRFYEWSPCLLTLQVLYWWFVSENLFSMRGMVLINVEEKSAPLCRPE